MKNIINVLGLILGAVTLAIVSYMLFGNDKLGSYLSTPPQSTMATSTTYTISSTSTYVEATTTRTYYSFTNAGTATIYLQFMGDAPAVAKRGVALHASSSPYEISVERGNPYYGAIRAITDAGANGTLVVTGF